MRSASNIPRALRKDQPRPIRILIPIYHDFNTFDVNGPIEILSQANRLSKTQHFKITIAAAEELTTSVELVRIARNISLADAIKGADDWDVLLLPGGTEPIIMSMIQSWHEDRNSKANELMRFVDEYVAPDSSRFTFTVCTGSLFLGALGKLNGRTATTHWGAIPTLKKIVAGLPSEFSDSQIVRARWVESGIEPEGSMSTLITAGGVSCGLDATFHLLDLTVGVELATKVAGALDYARRGEEPQY